MDKGFDADHVLTVDIDIAGPLYAEPVDRGEVLRSASRQGRRHPRRPGIRLHHAAAARGQTWNDPIYLARTRSRTERHAVDNRYASPGYFRAMNIAIRHGRVFEESDRGNSVAVLSEKAAKLLWPGEPNPVGRRFMGEDDAVKTLVGIVAEVRAALHETRRRWPIIPTGSACPMAFP